MQEFHAYDPIFSEVIPTDAGYFGSRLVVLGRPEVTDCSISHVGFSFRHQFQAILC